MPDLLHTCGSHRGPKVFFSLDIHYNAGLELVYIRKGSTYWRVMDTVYRVEPGDLFYTLPWEPHGGLEIEQPGLEIDWLDINVGSGKKTLAPPPDMHIPPAVWRKTARAFIDGQSRRVPGSPLIEQLISRIVELSDQPNQRHRLLMKNLLTALLLESADLIARGDPNPREVKDRSTVRVLQLIEDLRAHPEQPVNLNDMASSCGLKRSRFAYMVKHITGDSPIQLVNRLRIQQACKLLRNSQKSITEIAFEVGFESSQYFARIFRSYVGCSPSEFITETSSQP